MSFQVKEIFTPVVYHREYANDFSKKDDVKNQILRQALRVTQIALPFITLYRPLGKPVSIVLGSTRVISLVKEMISAISSKDSTRVGKTALEVAIASTALACSILAHPLGMMVTTAHDMVINVVQLTEAIQAQDYKKAAEMGLHLMNNALYLGCFFAGSLEWSVASIGMQIFLGLYHSCDEFKKGNYLEGGGHFLMAGIRGKQLYDQVGRLHLERKVFQSLPPIHQEAREREAIKNDPRLEKRIGDKAYEIKKVEGGYLVETDTDTFRVDVKYLPREDGMCGPAVFELVFPEL
jgi:hypothetical protein